MNEKKNLPRTFRKLSPPERRNAVRALIGSDIDLLDEDPAAYNEYADIMVENSTGIMGVPLGIAPGFLINNESYDVPMATEEPSVIAAAAYGAAVVASSGGFTAEATDPVAAAQIFFPETGRFDLAGWIHGHWDRIEERIRKETESLANRGGGLKGYGVSILKAAKVLKLDFEIDVRDAMGANRLNTTAENIAAYIVGETGIDAVMSILTNSSKNKTAKASFSLPVGKLSRLQGKSRSGNETAEKIVLANRIAEEDPDRAVTHNKGIMNGVSALALATGNDTRAVESAVHAWASRNGRYSALTGYRLRNGRLEGELTLPTPFATVGGSVGFHPTAQRALSLLGVTDAKTLSCVAASLGLAQNFAALLALTGTGIQKGHMALHARKTAFTAGARGNEIDIVASMLRANNTYGAESAESYLESVRAKRRKER